MMLLQNIILPNAHTCTRLHTGSSACNNFGFTACEGFNNMEATKVLENVVETRL